MHVHVCIYFINILVHKTKIILKKEKEKEKKYKRKKKKKNRFLFSGKRENLKEKIYLEREIERKYFLSLINILLLKKEKRKVPLKEKRIFLSKI